MALKNALIMQNDNGTTTTAIQIDTAITSNNVPVVINAAGTLILNQGAVHGIDYDYDFPNSTTVRVVSKVARNLKIRII